MLDVNEAYTSKTRSWDGAVNTKLGGAKAIRDDTGFGMDRDVNGARGIFLRALGDSPLPAWLAHAGCIATNSDIVECWLAFIYRSARHRDADFPGVDQFGRAVAQVLLVEVWLGLFLSVGRLRFGIAGAGAVFVIQQAGAVFFLQAL